MNFLNYTSAFEAGQETEIVEGMIDDYVRSVISRQELRRGMLELLATYMMHIPLRTIATVIKADLNGQFPEYTMVHSTRTETVPPPDVFTHYAGSLQGLLVTAGPTIQTVCSGRSVMECRPADTLYVLVDGHAYCLSCALTFASAHVREHL